MSISAKIDGGMLLDHKLHLDCVFNRTIVDHNKLDEKIRCFKFKECYFNLECPHISTQSQDIGMSAGDDSTNLCQSDEIQNGNKTNSTKSSCKVRKRRKRKSSFNHGEILAQNYHNAIKTRLSTVANKLCEYLTKAIEMSDMPSEDTEPMHAKHKICNLCEPNVDCRIRTLTTNACQYSHVIELRQSQYLIPGNSRFLCSDISHLKPLTDDCKMNGTYNCVVLDPPWENKSVKRGRRYDTLSFDQIANIPMRDLCAEECLVVVWVTNKQKIMKWVRETLFPTWNIQYLAEWHWVKVTKHGKPVFPWDSLHKKPYETILIGRYLTTAPQSHKAVKPTVLCSVPCKVHSHKPPLCAVLKPFLSEFHNPKCLEMFARSLTPGWTSWGNEVLMMQDASYFDMI